MTTVENIIGEALAHDVVLFLKDDQLSYVAEGGRFPEALRSRIKLHRQDIIEHLRRLDAVQEQRRHSLPGIERQPEGAVLPLSFSQQRLWFVDRVEGGSSRYNIGFAFQVKGELRLDPFERALGSLVARHESLRTTFVESDGIPRQVIGTAREVPLQLVDLSHVAASQRAAEAQRIVAQSTNAPFDLAADMMLRVTLVTLAPGEHVLSFTVHHIAADGWSLGVLVQEFVTLYAAYCDGQDSPLQPLPLRYADFAQWQRDWLRAEVLQEQLDYWRRRLDGIPSVHSLPLDFPRPVRQELRGEFLSKAVDAAATRALNQLARQCDTTLFVILHSAFALLLARVSNETEVVLGTPVAGRPHKDTESLVGFFVNSLVLRTRIVGNPSFAEYVRANHQSIFEDYEHQHVPFEMLVEHLKPERSSSYSPLFQIVFGLNNNQSRRLELAGLELTPVDSGTNTARADLELSIVESNAALQINCSYCSDLFTAASMRALLESYVLLLQGAASAPQSPILALPLLDAKQQQQLIAAGTGASWQPNDGLQLQSAFEAQVAATAEAAAAVDGAVQLTYRELNARANRLAHYLRDSGFGAGSRIGILAGRCVEQLIAVLGIAKAGAVYVPLEAAYPQDRIGYMVRDAQIGLILLFESQMEKVAFAQCDILFMDGAATAQDWLADHAASNPSPAGCDSDSVLYILYTSGSTGRPKGVMVTQGGAINYLIHAAQEYLHEELQSAVVSSPLCFDATLTTFLAPLLAGRAVVLLPEGEDVIERLYEHLMGEVPCLFKITPAHLDALSYRSRPSDSSQARHVIVVGGEQLSTATLLQWKRQLLPNATFINEYGPTETVVGCSIHRVFSSSEVEALAATKAVPIGRAIRNTRLLVLNEAQQLQPAGSTGELYIGGHGVAAGYVNLPHETAERFIRDPFATDPSRRLYRTGDLVRWLPEGNLEFIGRRDGQVKVRGYRIELGEIEHRLREVPDVAEALVMALPDPQQPSDKRLVAYIVRKPAESAAAGDWGDAIARYRARLSAALPDFMVPAVFVPLEAMPLTINGKVDKQRLPAPDVQAVRRIEHIEPTNPLEQRLCAMWVALLKIGRVGITDNFFDLGGHSLLALRMISRIRDELGCEVPLGALFDDPTVAALAQHISSQVQPPPLPAVERADRSLPLPLSFAQQRLWFIDRLDGSSIQYSMPGVFRLSGRLEVPALVAAFREIFRRHEVLRTGFVEDAAGVRQVVRSGFEVPLAVVDLSALSEAARRSEIGRLCHVDRTTPFDLSQDLLLRIALLKVAASEHLVLFNMHHIASDGWSLGVLVREFCEVYAAHCTRREPQLPELAIQYADYAAWQRRWLSGKMLEEQLGYWRRRLEGIPEVHSLPLDRPRPARISYRGAGHEQRIEPALLAQIDALCRRARVTRFMLLQTAFALLLGRWSNESDIVMGTTVAGRTHKELEALIGFFVNTLVIRTDLSGNPRFLDLLQASKAHLLQDFAHQHVPFEMLVEQLNPSRDASHSPLFQVAFSLHNNEQVPVALPQLEFRLANPEITTSHFELTLNVNEIDDTLLFTWVYNPDLFDTATIQRLAAAYRMLLAELAQDASRPVQSLRLVQPEAARDLVLRGATLDIRPGTSVHDLFEEQVRAHADDIAVLFGERRLSYGALHERSRRLAHYLVSVGVGREARIGVYLDRSPELLIAILGIMQAGAVYVPLEPSHPRERTDYMVRDAGIELVLLHSKRLAALQLAGIDVLLMDEADCSDDWLAEFAQTSDPAERLSQVAGEDLIYVLYTSGSTGRPKGVMITHGGVVNYLRYARDHYFGPAIRGAVVSSPLCFDATVTSLLAPLCCGLPVVLLPDGDAMLGALTRYLFDPAAAWLFKITPAHLEAIAHAASDAGPVHTPHFIVVGGEQLFVQNLLHWTRELLPAATFVNEYGPTETVVGCSTYFVHAAAAQKQLSGQLAVPIGEPICNTRLYVLNEQLQLQPQGCIGELYIGGAGLARGYLNRAELTGQRFIEPPAELHGDARLYKTGDLVRMLPDRQLQFVGRADSQVKIRGFRVELGEIEAELKSMPTLRDAAVLLDPADRESSRLLACLVVDASVAPAAARAVPLLAAGRIDPAQLFRIGNGLEVYGLNRSETEYLYDEIFVRRVYERHGITIRDGDCVFDVGANIGAFSIYLTTRLPHVQVHCFEPIPAVYQRLEINARMFGPGQIAPHCYGLAETARQAQFSFYPHASLYSGVSRGRLENIEIVKQFLDNKGQAGDGDPELEQMVEVLSADRMTTESVEVQLSTVSAEIARHGIESIDLLKVDVERSEIDVLHGIEPQDWPKIRQVVVEVHDVDGAVEYVSRLLIDKGFTVVAEQDADLKDTELVNLYARRSDDVAASLPAVPPAAAPVWQGLTELKQQVRQRLQARLPDYMVPAALMFVPEIPLTHNGKVDHRALAAARQVDAHQQVHVAPRTPLEATLCRIWERLLGVERIGVRDNFFAAGGHSLIAIRLVSAIRHEFRPHKVELQLSVLFAAPTVEGIAPYVERELAAARLAEQREQLLHTEVEIEEGEIE